MNKTKISAEVVVDSVDPRGNRLTSLLITFPRIILAEINTHRMLSKNTSSSRAIPFKKMVESVQNDPFIPIAWQKEHTGMQGEEYITDEEKIQTCIDDWLVARNNAIESAKTLNKGFNRKDEQGNWIQTEEIDFTDKVTKQLCNRLLEPFMWTTMLITGSKEGWNNFFELRCPSYKIDDIDNTRFKSWKDLISFIKGRDKVDDSVIESYEQFSVIEKLQKNKGQAEIHIMDLAEKIYDAMNESTPKQLQGGEWHIPFEDKMHFWGAEYFPALFGNPTQEEKNILKVKISTAMAARTSYTVVGEEKGIDYQKMIDLHDRLIGQNPPHSSPMEHCARVMTSEEYYLFNRGEAYIDSWHKSPDILGFTPENRGWCRNFKGFIQYRHIIETQNK